jgi:Secretion system C-terminal sorting domain
MVSMFELATVFNQPLGCWDLNSAFLMSDMIADCGMDCTNYSQTLHGWANNINTPSFIILSPFGRVYGTNVVVDRNNLINNKGWSLSGDMASSSACPFPTTFCNAPTQTSNHKSNLTVSAFYPNPSSVFSSLNIESNNAQDAYLVLYNSLGQVVFTKTISLKQGFNACRITTHQLSSGVYAAHILIGADRITKQLIVR